MLIGTPAYMSPEQAELAQRRTSIRAATSTAWACCSTSCSPARRRSTRSELLEAGLRRDAAHDPRRGAAAAVDAVDHDERRGPGNGRSIAQPNAPKLIRELRGDLDWIVMKALEKDRARRYETANGLAMDIERYLSGEAILARPPSAAYKFRKLAARNKLLFSGVAADLCLLVISLITTPAGW